MNNEPSDIKPGTTFVPLWHFVIENSVIDVLTEAKHHARISIDRIKFAIRHSKQFAPQSDPVRPLNRLQSVERHFNRAVRASNSRLTPGTQCNDQRIRGEE